MRALVFNTMRKDKRPMARKKVKVVRLPHAAGLDLPAYQTPGAAGMDLLAALGEGRPVVLAPGKRALIPTGLVLELPKGTEAQVRPRSGLALKHGVTVLNSPGTIDSDYRGEVGVLLVNLGEAKFKIERGARIAQLVVQKVEQMQLIEVTSAAASQRGAGGFGSTGISAKGDIVASRRKSAPAAESRTKISKTPAEKPMAKRQEKAENKVAGGAQIAPGLQKSSYKAGQAKAGSHAKSVAEAQSLQAHRVPVNPLNQLRLDAHRGKIRAKSPLRKPVSPRSP